MLRFDECFLEARQEYLEGVFVEIGAIKESYCHVL
jgi:hypothetical protein